LDESYYKKASHLPMYMPRVVDMLLPASWLSTDPLLLLLLLLPLLLRLPKVAVKDSKLRACCSEPPAEEQLKHLRLFWM
jgi:hypothetical protein